MSSNQKISKELIAFLIECEKLKIELRHSWTSDRSRQESVAEHSWMSALMAMTFFEHISFDVDQLKVMKMVIIHDLGEVIIGDIPAHEVSSRQSNKYDLESEAIEKLAESVQGVFKKELIDLWHEYEAHQTNEAKLAKAIDKVEVLIQHNVAAMDTWDEGDFRIGMLSYKDEYFNDDGFLRAFRDEVNRMNWQKLKESGKISELLPAEIEMGKAQFER